MPLSMILSAASSADASFSEDKKGFLSGFGLENTFASTMGGVTSFIVGNGRITNIYSSDRKTVHNLAEMLRFFYNYNAAPTAGFWPTVGGIAFGFATNATDGGDTSYVFGSRKALTYRFTPNFTVDRFCNTEGWIGQKKTGQVTDISFKPKKHRMAYMVLAALFSTGLLAFDLVLHYKLNYKTSKDTETSKVSITMKGMMVFEFLCLLAMNTLEKKCFYAVETLEKGITVLKERIDKTEKELAIAQSNISLVLLLPVDDGQAMMLADARELANAAKESFDLAKEYHASAVANVNSAW